MEAKDTVMTWKQIVECSHNPVLELREKAICLAQAEISYKAGIKEVVGKLNEIAYSDAYDELKWERVCVEILEPYENSKKGID